MLVYFRKIPPGKKTPNKQTKKTIKTPKPKINHSTQKIITSRERDIFANVYERQQSAIQLKKQISDSLFSFCLICSRSIQNIVLMMFLYYFTSLTAIILGFLGTWQSITASTHNCAQKMTQLQGPKLLVWQKSQVKT